MKMNFARVLCLLFGVLMLAGCGNDPITRSMTERPPEFRDGPPIFAGRVIDNSARPMGGVTVTARLSEKIVADPESLPVAYRGVTTSAGAFGIPRQESRALYITFTKPGFITHARWLYLLKGGESKPPTAPIEITFLSADVPVVNDTIIILYDVNSVIGQSGQ